MYLLIQRDEDGNPNTFLDEPIGEFLNSALEEYGVKEFKDAAYLKENSDPNFWPAGVAVLAKIEVVVPKPVRSKWSIQ